MSDVCLSVAYIGPKSKTGRTRKTKVDTEVAHVTRDSDTTLRSKGQGHRGGAYCGSLPHTLLCPRLIAGALSDDARLTSVCLSVCKSRTEMPRKIKIGTEVALAHVIRDYNTTFSVKRSKVNLHGAKAYCGGLPHSLYHYCYVMVKNDYQYVPTRAWLI